MKNKCLVIVIMLSLLLLLIPACGGGNDETSTSTNVSTETLKPTLTATVAPTMTAKRARLPDGRHISGKRITDREPMEKGMMIPRALVRIMALLDLITWPRSTSRPEMKTNEINPR